MLEAIPEPREEVRETAPKIVSFEIPIDKIGEVIGPKGKVINTIQGETGADISVDDDGMVGIVAISSTDNAKVAEAKRQIELILDPPTAEVGAEYAGRVVNITKFGAFVNILPGRDGLLHISKIGGSKRIDKVEDVLELGQEVQVVVEDVDPNGKISLKPVGDGPEATGGVAAEASDDTPAEASGDRESVSFESAFDSDLADEFGDLGPEACAAPAAAVVVAVAAAVVVASPVTIGQTKDSPSSRTTPRSESLDSTAAFGSLPSPCPVALRRGRGMDRVGNRDEPAELAGVSHFLEHLLFKGSSTRSAQDIARASMPWAVISRAHVKEYTAFTLGFLWNSTSA